MAVNLNLDEPDENAKPEPVTPRGGGRGYPPPTTQSGPSRLYVAVSTIAAIVVSLILVYVLFIGNLASKKDFADQKGTVATSLATMQKNLDTTTAGQTNQINNISDRVSSLSSSLSSYAGKSDLKGFLTSSDLAGYAKTADLGTYAKNAELAALRSQVETNTATIATLKTQILALQTTANTTYTTNVSAGLLTATVLGNTFTGSTTLSVSTNGSQTFQFVLMNNAGRTLNNIQLAIGLEILDFNNSPILAGPSGNLTIASNGILWQAQSTGYAYLLGFVNTSTSGVFGGIGQISQGVGQTTYSVTVTASGVSTPFYIYPIIKIVSYS